MTDQFDSDPTRPQQPAQPHEPTQGAASTPAGSPTEGSAAADMSYRPSEPAPQVAGAPVYPQTGQVPPGQAGPTPHPGVESSATAPQPVKRRFGVRQLISLLVLALVLGFGLYGIVKRMADNNTMKVGNCVQITQNSSKEEDNTRKKVGCDTDQSWMITQSRDSSAKCSEYEETFEYVDKKNNNVTKALCLMPNMQQGKCYSAKEPTSFPAVVGFRSVACSDTSADLKVDKRLDSDDAKQCSGSSEKALTYSTSAVHRVYCIAKAS